MFILIWETKWADKNDEQMIYSLADNLLKKQKQKQKNLHHFNHICIVVISGYEDRIHYFWFAGGYRV